MLPDRFLHILTGKKSGELLASLDLGHMRKRYVGDHVALTNASNESMVRESGLFNEVHVLDMNLVQRCSFSPLLGDEVGFRYFYQAMGPLASQTWTRVLNLSGDSLGASLAAIIPHKASTGCVGQGIQEKCTEAPLKLARMLDNWKIGHSAIQQWLTAKTLGQLDWAAIECAIMPIAETKGRKDQNVLKSLHIGIRPGILDNDQRQRLEQIFTVSEAIGDNVEDLFFDAIVCNDSSVPAFQRISVNQLDSETLADMLGSLVPQALSKWTTLAFLFDYLGNPRLALISEKILARYDRETLQMFLKSEVGFLKHFAKPLLDSMRKSSPDTLSNISQSLTDHGSTIAFLSAMELSLSPSLSPIIRGDNELVALKNRMRSLNQFYERLHRATALELPKTDLALTL